MLSFLISPPAVRSIYYSSSPRLLMLTSDPQPTVRLPTPKTTQSSKSNGYAFLEFTDKKALQQALRLHHSELEGRKINVELTAGGGGKSEHRVKKLQERNKGLHEQRVPHFRIPFFLYFTDLHLLETANRETEICFDERRGDQSVRDEGT
jgi:RNA recognition motif-containing protein